MYVLSLQCGQAIATRTELKIALLGQNVPQRGHSEPGRHVRVTRGCCTFYVFYSLTRRMRPPTEEQDSVEQDSERSNPPIKKTENEDASLVLSPRPLHLVSIFGPCPELRLVAKP